MAVVIDNLPDEVLFLVFSRFDLLEKLRLRAVCWRWKLIIQNFRIKDISIVDSKFNRSNRIKESKKWMCVGLESLNCQNLIYYSNDSNDSNPSLYRRLTSLFGSFGFEKLSGSLQFVSKRPMFARLKSMFISFESIDTFSFEKYINPHFPQLEQLSCFNLYLGEKTCLSLANLKVLSLCSVRGPRIRLELPSMYKLVTALSLDSLEFANPRTVTHLFVREDDESITQLSNLEYFSCLKLKNEAAMFSNLTKLKEVHIRHQENSEERFAEIYETKQRLGRCELKMFVGQLDYQFYRQHPFLLNKETLRRFLSRGCSSTVVNTISNIYYDNLLDALDGQAISSSLLSNVFNVRIIEGIARRSSKDDVDAFFKLLGDFPSLYILKLTWPLDGPNDKQTYYDSLPSHCRFLRELELCESGNQKSLIDLNFVLNFGYLQCLKLAQDVRPILIESLFGKLKYFQTLKAGERSQIQITKTEHDSKISLSGINGKEDTFDSLSNLLAFYQEMAGNK